MLYCRVGHHSTSDDSTAYRSKDEIDHWVASNNPLTRFGAYLRAKGIWNDTADADFKVNIRTQILEAFSKAEKLKKPRIAEMFNDVYDELPWNLKEQMGQLKEALDQYPEAFPTKGHVSFE